MSPGSTRLRVGILMESLDVPAWQFALLESVLESDCADIALLIFPHRAQATASRDVDSRSNRGAVYRAFKRLEDKNRKTGPDACAVTSAESLLGTVDRIALAPAPAGQFDPAAIELIRTRELDVLVALVEPMCLPTDVSLARLGLWCLEVNGRAISPPDGSLTGFQELIRRQPYLASSLQILQPAAVVIRTAYQTFSAIDYLSHDVTRNEHLWKCSTFISRALKKCHSVGGEAYLRSLPTTPATRGHDIRLGAGTSGSVESYFAFLSYFLWRVKRKLFYRIYRERWILMFGLDSQNADYAGFASLVPPAGRFWADPHVVARDGSHHVFFEDASQQTGHGYISLMSDAGDGNFAPPKAILQRPYHLSYPFVFEWQDTYFLIPESAQNQTIELYRCTRFPDLWSFEHNLMQGISAYDATLVEHAGIWWLFANVREREGASTWDELCIFYSDNPLSREWKSHRENPVISDVRHARPAGRLFAENGRLYRPSQDSSRRYGHALHINEVLELNERSYKEVPVETLEPDRNHPLRAVHSYSRAGRVTFIDAIRREPQFRAQIGRVTR